MNSANLCCCFLFNIYTLCKTTFFKLIGDRNAEYPAINFSN